MSTRPQLVSRGFTIIELLVYLAIFVTVTAGSISLLFALEDVYQQYVVKQTLMESGTAIMERVLYEVREANQVLVGDSVLATATTTAGVLTLSVDSDVSTSSVNSIRHEAGQLLIESGGAVAQLHDDTVTIAAARWYVYEQDGVQFVRLSLDLTAEQAGYAESLTLESGAIIRQTYVSS